MFAAMRACAHMQTRNLKEKQRELRETHTTGLSQIDMMNDLVKLLQVGRI
jgi:intraflagellar transport protein 81